MRVCVRNCRRGSEAETEGRDSGDGEVLGLEVWQRRARQSRTVFQLFAALGGESGMLQLLPLVLVAPVLEPDLYLRLGEVQHRRELFPLVRREILLDGEASLQLVDLGVREEGPGSPFLVLARVNGRTCTRQRKTNSGQ